MVPPMTFRVVSVALCLSACVAACGKSGKEEPTPAQPAQQPAPASGGNLAPAPSPSQAPAQAAEPAKPREAAHAVYSLVDNRLSAHLSRGGGLVIPAGSAGFAKYQRFGNLMKGAKRAWELRQREGDVKVARFAGKTATVYVPLTAAQAAAGTIRMRAHSDGSSTLSVRVNDNKDINGKLASGWSTAELKIPPNQLHEGENGLALFVKGAGVELAWIEVGGDALPDDGQTELYDAASKSLVIPKGGAMSWFVAIPDKAKVVADGDCAVDVLATADDGTTAQGKLPSVDLAPVAGKAVRLELTATSCDAKLANASIVVAGDLAQVKRGDPPKYVLFIIMDSLRADRVRAFNPKARPETPNWEKLAETSTVFATDYVQGNESQVSHAAIWSSNYLAKHKAIEFQDVLADKWVTIDEVARKANKFVAGASGNGYIRPSRGFGSGWNKFVNHIESDLGLRGSDIIDKGLSFVQPKKDQPWFLYVGLIDTHVTWRAKKPWIDKYDGGYKGRFQTEYGDEGPNGSDGSDLNDHEKDHVRALYDSNVSYQDDLMGQLVDKLKGWGVWDQTMLIITADHGDEQWEESNRVGHGASERDTLLHVPLLVHYPAMFPAVRVTEGTESIDIVPTLADALGVPGDAEWQGMSLIPLANGQGGYPLMSFSSQYENWHAGRIDHYKVKLYGSGMPKVYDLAKDPDERTDLYGKNEIAARLLLDPMWMLRQWNVEWKKSQWGNAADVSSRFASDLGE